MANHNNHQNLKATFERKINNQVIIWKLNNTLLSAHDLVEYDHIVTMQNPKTMLLTVHPYTEDVKNSVLQKQQLHTIATNTDHEKIIMRFLKQINNK